LSGGASALSRIVAVFPPWCFSFAAEGVVGESSTGAFAAGLVLSADAVSASGIAVPFVGAGVLMGKVTVVARRAWAWRNSAKVGVEPLGVADTAPVEVATIPDLLGDLLCHRIAESLFNRLKEA